MNEVSNRLREAVKVGRILPEYEMVTARERAMFDKLLDGLEQAANEIERLERELAEEHAVNVQAQKLLDAEILRTNEIQAQAAVMREALNVALWRIEKSESWLAVDSIKAALSSDAGKAVLRVVEMMKELIEAIDKGALEMNSPDIVVGDENPHPWHQEWEYYVREALAAMGKVR